MSNLTSIPAALWEWFEECASITKLFFTFADATAESTAISPAGDTLLEAYIDGSERRQYAFELIRFLPATFAPNDPGNVDMMEDVERIIDWVRDRDADGDYPLFPDGYIVESIVPLDQTTGFIAAQDLNLAKYMIPFAVTYTIEKE